MKLIEQKISTFVKNQFPAFYKQEGEQFIAFCTAYYEWLEEENNTTYESRNLANYRDIDTTLEEFIIHFKEKYLKNIQFDTATNKTLLVKNALNLYRSKGTERSVDLFFKLVYGVPAEIRYPSENILRASDGIWEKPQYLEISYSRENINYVNKQIIGSRSGATAFVEKYIRRKTDVGYVDLLYVSNIVGNFINNEVLGTNVNGKGVFTLKNSTLLGSIKEVIIQDGGVDFKVGDIVNLISSDRGVGALARVASVSNATGVVDFIFLESGYGYTLNANSIISEKVIELDDLQLINPSDSYFNIFDPVYQPIINVNFTSATSTINAGDIVYRYNGANIISEAVVVDVTQNNANGSLTLLHSNGCFVNSASYQTSANVTLFANTVENRTVSGKLTGISDEYVLTVENVSGSLSIGDVVYQANTTDQIGSGTVKLIENNNGNTDVTIQGSRGVFNLASTSVVGSNTTFDITKLDTSIGLHDINEYITRINYTGANNDNITKTDYVYQYVNGVEKYKAKVITGAYVSNTGTLDVIPIKGFYNTLKPIYSSSNTAKATLASVEFFAEGGDFISTPLNKIFSNTASANIVSISVGVGAGFNIASIGDQETIFIGTDILNSNNYGYTNYSRKQITVASNTNIAIGDTLYQKTLISGFNPSTSINGSTGFITLASANSKFLLGDVVRYEVSTGNTAVVGLENLNYYAVQFSNSTGLILAQGHSKTTPINTTTTPNFNSTPVNEAGHLLYKEAAGSIYNITANNLFTDDIRNAFVVSGANNSNVMLYSNNAVNTAISAVVDVATAFISNTNYMSLPIRSSAYGFPKNVQGDLNDTIYSCLNFDDFRIGSVGGITNVDPGSNYNVDPFVLIYEPYIAAFNRNDFVFNITGLTSSFIVGEQISQTSANLVNFDVQVSGGVYGNTFNEVSKDFNPLLDIDAANDVIYIPEYRVTFNSNTGVTNSFITTTASSSIINGAYVKYTTSTGNTALSGLSNNAFYYVIEANTSGFKLSTTPAGAAISLTASATVESGHTISSYNNPYANNLKLQYRVPLSNTAVSGLSNNGLYFVIQANSVAMKLSATQGGSAINISTGSNETHSVSTVPGFLPLDTVYQIKTLSFNASSNVSSALDFITTGTNPFSNSDLVTYTVATGNTAISGLANNTSYYVVDANSTGFKVSSTVGGGAINITSGASETGHTFTANVTGIIDSVYTVGANSVVRVKNVNNSLIVGSNLNSQSYSTLTSNVISVTPVSITSTAKGVVKEANSSIMKIKRLTFENTFQDNQLIIGETSGANATLISLVEDETVNQIGLNANVSANAIAANGQISSLQVIDSGYGYTNSEIVQFTSEDGTRSGSVKVVIDGYGISKGYYRSTKGFLSADMYIHDGDFYQEYSYEVLSKISFDKYSEMFKKVMHMAGTKFFGSVVISEQANTTIDLVSTNNQESVSFNAQLDVSSAADTIEIDIEKDVRRFNTLAVNSSVNSISITMNPFSNGDLVTYYTSLGNTAITGLSNNGLYYIVDSTNNDVKLSTSQNGSVIAITYSVSEAGHHLLSYKNPFSNGDLVTYSTATGNTIVSGLANNGVYRVSNTTPKTVQLANVTSNSLINIVSSSTSEVGHFLTKNIEE